MPRKQVPFTTHSYAQRRRPTDYEVFEKEVRLEYREAMSWTKHRLHERTAQIAGAMASRLADVVELSDPLVKKYRYIDLVKAMNRVKYVLDDIEKDIREGEAQLLQ